VVKAAQGDWTTHGMAPRFLKLVRPTLCPRGFPFLPLDGAGLLVEFRGSIHPFLRYALQQSAGWIPGRDGRKRCCSALSGIRSAFELQGSTAKWSFRYSEHCSKIRNWFWKEALAGRKIPDESVRCWLHRRCRIFES